MSGKLRIVAAAVLALALPITACSDDGTSSKPGNPLVATWNVTSFQNTSTGEEYVAQGLTLSITFRKDGTYSLVFANDVIDACDGAASCTIQGTYTTSGTTLSLTDSSTPPETTQLTYQITGSTMTWNGDIDGTVVQIHLQKAT